MSTNFPGSLDSLTNPTSTDTLANPSHSSQHANANDAIEALQAKVGVDSSAVSSSLDYKVTQLETNSATLSGSETLTNKTIDLTDNTVTGTLAEFNAAVSDADLVSLDGSETLTNKLVRDSVLYSVGETWLYSNQAISTAENLSLVSSSAVYNYTTASGNFTLNLRYSTTTTFDSVLDVGNSVTAVWAITNGATPYYLTALTIDGNAQTVKWQGGSAPTSGNANSVDVYVFTVLKTAATPTYVVLGSMTKYA